MKCKRECQIKRRRKKMIKQSKNQRIIVEKWE
jgi:hypothetical protein